MSSPFKFLDAFERSDKAIFFGRSAEIEQLYRMVFEASLVLVYGTSGTGKTSLIQCGLANRFAQTDWFELFVRRTDDINLSLSREIRGKVETPIPAEASVVEAIRSLYLDHLRPVYLIFDQFEELFILGSREEQDLFFQTIADLIASDVSCKIIISLREEYLASLHRFEEVVPTLFNKRLRVEPMSMRNVEEVIAGSTAALGIGLEQGVDTARLIIDQLEDERGGIQLAYLQVYLDSLYQRASARGEPVVFTDDDVRETGKLGDIMAEFLTEQTALIQARLGAAYPTIHPTAVAHLLEEFVTVEGTKQPTSRDELFARLPDNIVWLDDALSALQSARILRKVNDRFELAHDSLAGRIAESRSGERRAMLMVQKIVRDRVAAFPQMKSLLNAEEVAVVNRGRRQRDPIRGTPLLELTAEEEKFVRKSTSRLRWKRYRFVVFNAVVALIILFSLGLAFIQELELDEQAVAATHATDRLVFNLFTRVGDETGTPEEREQQLQDKRQELLQQIAIMNTDREKSLAQVQGDTFWRDLMEADMLVESADPRESEAGQKRHLDLQRDLDAALAEDAFDLRARSRLVALQWRLYRTARDDRQAAAHMRKLLDLAYPAESYRPVDFQQDIDWACDVLAGLEVRDRRCAALPR